MEGDPVPAVSAGSVALGDGHSARVEEAEVAQGILPGVWTRRLFLLAVGAGVLTALGAIVDPTHTGTALLVASQYVLGLGLGGMVFVAFSYVAKAGWSVAFRRVPEVFAATLPLGGLLTLLALAFLPWLYEWSHAEVVQADPILQGKTWWLSPGFFLLRAVLYIVVWIVLSRAILRTSSRQDLDGDVHGTHRNVVLSAIFLIVFAVTFTAATFDWLMSLEPHWFSTVYAVYNFAGLFTSALCAILVVAIGLRRLGPFRGVLKPDHVHDLAKLVFGFATFWAYIWFCQYMLIWYANIPEETSYYALRQNGAWGVLQLVNVIVNWLIPFLVLLPRPAKRSESVVLKVAALLLLGRWLDLYLMVQPSHAPDGPRPTLWDVSAMVMSLALFTLVVSRILSRVRLVPRGDPMLEESLHHHT